MVVSTHQRRRYIQAREKPGTTKYRSHSKKKWFTILVDCFFYWFRADLATARSELVLAGPPCGPNH